MHNLDFSLSILSNINKSFGTTKNLVWNECVNLDIKVHQKIDNLPKFKKNSWYIDNISLLLPLQTAYYTKLPNLPELITHPIIYNDASIILLGKTSPRKTPSWRTAPWKISSLQSPPINHSFGVAVVETSDDFSIIYIFITIFVKI